MRGNVSELALWSVQSRSLEARLPTDHHFAKNGLSIGRPIMIIEAITSAPVGSSGISFLSRKLHYELRMNQRLPGECALQLGTTSFVIARS